MQHGKSFYLLIYFGFFFFLMSTVKEECWSKRPSSLKLLEVLFFIFFNEN